jgi:predicted O-methyltransferase YrrM
MHDEKGKTGSIDFRWVDAVRRLADSRLGALCWGKSWRKLHSPSLFEMGKALQPNPKHWPAAVTASRSADRATELESVRKKFLLSHESIARLDLGAGSRRLGGADTRVRVRDLARRSLTPAADLAAFCRWLQVVAPHGRQGRFLELGSSLGLTAAGVASLGWDVQTWEGCPETLRLAKQAWMELGLSDQIDAREGDFRDLVKHLATDDVFDVVYLDGLHEEHATRDLAKALEQHVGSCLVVDDIAWSPGMNRAWRALQGEEVWRVSFTWRGRGFLLKAPHMARERFRLV